METTQKCMTMGLALGHVKTKLNPIPRLLVAALLAGWALPASAQITAVNRGNFGGSAPGATVTQSITVGAAADMLVVMTSAELAGGTPPMTVTYGGVAMDLAVGNLDNSSIWYLDLATPGITGTNVVVDMSGYGVRNGFAAGWVSIDGNLGAGESITLHSTGTSAAQTSTVDLTTAVQTFNVVNFNGNNKAGPITVNSPNPTVIYTDNDIGSARAAAAYAAGVVAGTHTYQWTISDVTPPNADYRRIDAAAFAVVTEGEPPVIVTTSPADNTVNVAVDANLIATFSEPVVAGASGTITLKKTSDDSTVESFDVTSSTRLAFDGQTLTIDPTVNLLPAVEYYVLIDTGAVLDTSGGDAFAGISDTTAWSFTVDSAPPVLASLVPADDATAVAVGANLVATFDEPIMAGTGFITLKRSSDDSTVESFDVTSSTQLTFSGAILTINPTSDLDFVSGYYVNIDATAVKDISGNAFAGLAGTGAWNFTTLAISVVNHGNFGGSAPGATVSQSITVGAGADMLIVMTSAELGDLTGIPMTVTYGGAAMNLAVGNLGNSAIWYLDLATPGITGTSVVVDMSGYGARNGFAAGWVSIDGHLGVGESIALHSTGTSAAESNTVDLTAAFETFNVVNFNGNTSTAGTATVNSPNPTVIYTDQDIGSARSAAAYAAGVAGGTHTYQWSISGVTPPNADYRRIDAAAFTVVTGGGSPYDAWAGGPFSGTLTDPNPALDFDGGGLDTGLEWVLGGDPTDGSDDADIAPAFNNTSDPDFFIFTYRRDDKAAVDANTAIKVEYSSNLSGWTEAAAGADIIITPTDDGGGAGIDLVQVKIRRTLAVGGKLFARLNVVVTTP